MATKQARGTKRTCQSEDCGSRFYDLDRDPITCPICGELYEIASAPQSYAQAREEEKAARKARMKPEPIPTAEADGELPAAEGVESLEDVEEAEATTEDDETFLPVEEEEGGDVTTIIGPVDGEEET